MAVVECRFQFQFPVKFPLGLCWRKIDNSPSHQQRLTPTRLPKNMCFWAAVQSVLRPCRFKHLRRNRQKSFVPKAVSNKKGDDRGGWTRRA